jgi:hypothetical protein
MYTNPTIAACDKLEELGEDFEERLSWNLAFGYVYASPTAFAMAHVYDLLGEQTMWVDVVAGNMLEAISHAPNVKRVCYLRRGKLKSLKFDQLWKHLLAQQLSGNTDHSL